jgi:hypothetical protein
MRQRGSFRGRGGASVQEWMGWEAALALMPAAAAWLLGLAPTPERCGGEGGPKVAGPLSCQPPTGAWIRSYRI